MASSFYDCLPDVSANRAEKRGWLVALPVCYEYIPKSFSPRDGVDGHMHFSAKRAVLRIVKYRTSASPTCLQSRVSFM